MNIEVLTDTPFESLMPLTAYADGSRLTQTMDLEGKVKFAGVDKTASDAFLKKVLNYEKEQQAILRFMANFERQNSHLSEAELEQAFDELFTKWLTKQMEFALSENGCEKYLQVQPSYGFTVIKHPNGHEVIMTGLEEYGDLSHSYAEENARVGKGLQALYALFASKTASPDLWAGIVSPTEEYQQDYVSKTDVINLWQVIKHESNRTEAAGKYLILNQVLGPTERRFVHNLFYGLKQGNFTLQELLELDQNQLRDKISTSKLECNDPSSTLLPEYQALIADPNSFIHSGRGEDALFEMTQQLDAIFTTRFGKQLISTKDMQMYPIVKALAREYIPFIKSILIQSQGKDVYYREIRRMIYHCQALWALTQKPDENTVSQYHYEAGSVEFMEEHLALLANGVIQAGFEMSSEPLSYSGSDYLNWSFDKSYLQIDPSKPLGWELKQLEKHCRQHGEYTGDSCPDCHKAAEKKQKTKQPVRQSQEILSARHTEKNSSSKSNPPNKSGSLLNLLLVSHN